MLKQEKTNIVRLQCSDSSMEARCHSWFLQLLLAWQCDLLPHATQGQQAGTSPVAAPMCLAFIFSLKNVFPGFYVLYLSLSFLFSFLLALPSHLEAWHTAHYLSSKMKEKEERKREEERTQAYVSLFVSKATGRSCRALALSQPHARGAGAAQCPTGTGGRLSVCLSVCLLAQALGKWCETNKPRLCCRVSSSCRAAAVAAPSSAPLAG